MMLMQSRMLDKVPDEQRVAILLREDETRAQRVARGALNSVQTHAAHRTGRFSLNP